MKIALAAAFMLALALTAAAPGQDSGSAPPAGENSGKYGGGYGRGGFGGMGMMGRGVMGTVTETAADHYTVKTDAGDVYTVHFSANTRIFRMRAGMRRGDGDGGGQGSGQGAGQGSGQGWGQGRRMGGNPPEEIKPADIEVGDTLEARGEVDAAAKSVGATAIVLVDPERARMMREMEASYGKTWLMGKVTAIDGVKVTLTGSLDNAPHTFVADENTTFRRRRDPITLADIQVGDTVRVEGAVKDSAFTAATVSVMGRMPGENPTVPRNTPPSSSPQ